jgi:Cys-rich protein (TIGR01571 family)
MESVIRIVGLHAAVLYVSTATVLRLGWSNVYGGAHIITFTLIFGTVAAGQVISRLHLTWNGQPGNTSQTAGGFQTILILVVAYVIVRILLFIWSLFYIDLDNDGHLIVLDILTDVVHYSFYGWTVYVLWNVRIRLREKYAIPSQGTEDFCCSCFCPCFVAAQMLRHTTDYETYPATCCTERGIPAHAPSIV